MTDKREATETKAPVGSLPLSSLPGPTMIPFRSQLLVVTCLGLLCGDSLAIAAGVAAPAPAAAEGPSNRQPNVVVILADDAGWGDFSVTGNRTVTTPAVDSLAADGCLLETFFVQPVCAPTRAEFLTGRWHPRGGVRGVTEGAERLDPGERTIADVFHAGGYATGCFGKWHNGTQWPYHPLARGFDRFYGFTEGHWGSYFDPPMESDGRFVQGAGYIADDLTDKALAFIRAHHSHPFFCYVAYNTPHSPMSVPAAEWDRFRERELAQPGSRLEDPAFTRAALAMVENLDGNLGRLLRSLDDCGVADDTIVVFFSDNGPNNRRWCGGFRGHKGSTDDGGVRSVCCLRWPGRIPAGQRRPEPTAAIDLLPTLAGLAGLATAECRPLDGLDLTPLITTADAASPLSARLRQRPIIASFRGEVSVRTAAHRLDHQGRLYDMLTDPGQKRDIASEHPETADRLSGIAATWRTEVLEAHPAPAAERFPVGFPGAPHTELPARDGTAAGGITRSGRAPNCSFFTNWTSTDDSICWLVDVLTPGRYTAELWYTCAESDLGGTIQLSCDPQPPGSPESGNVAAVIATAWDPPLNTGVDRVDRDSESYDKPFKPLTLGDIDLPRGQARLVLRARDIPGANVADVRRLVLRPAGRDGPAPVDDHAPQPD